MLCQCQVLIKFPLMNLGAVAIPLNGLRLNEVFKDVGPQGSLDYGVFLQCCQRPF